VPPVSAGGGSGGARRRHAAGEAPGNVAVTVRLPYRPPLDWLALLAFLAPRATPGVEVVAGGVYRRTIAVGHARGTIAVRPDRASHLLLRVSLDRRTSLAPVVARARRLFDLDTDPADVAGHLSRSRVLAPLVARRPGLRVPGAWDGFELAVRAVLGQQVTVRGATTLAGRLVRAFGTAVADNDGLTHLFPPPDALVDADVASIGLPRTRAATIRALATAVAQGVLPLDVSSGLDDAVARLTAVPGIGPWTAHYIAMRALAERDAFPAGDLGLRRALGGGRTAPRSWAPWRAYAAVHLWTSLSEKEGTA